MDSKKNSESSDSSDASETNGGTYEVENIIADRYNRGTHEFRIRWLGYPPDADTWEPEDSLDCPLILKAYLDKQKRKDRKHKSKRGGKAKKRRASRSPSPGPSRVKDGILMDDVYDSAPKTPPEIDNDEESDNPLFEESSNKTKRKENPTTPLAGNDMASTSKSKSNQTDPGPSSSTSERIKKKKSSKGKHKSSRHKRHSSSTSKRTERERSTSRSKTNEQRTTSNTKNDKSGRDTALSEASESSRAANATEQSSSAKDKTSEASITSDATLLEKSTNDGSKTKTSSSVAKTTLSEKERSDKVDMATKVLGQLLSDALKKPASNATTTPRGVTVTLAEKEKSKAKENSSSASRTDKTIHLNFPEQSVNISSAATPVENPRTNATDEVSSLASNSVTISSTPTIDSLSPPVTTSSASNSHGVSQGISLSNSRPASAQSRLVPISEILAMNPPILKDELSEISGHLSSTSITMNLPDESRRKSPGIAQELSKTRKQYAHSRSSSSSASVGNAADRPGSSKQSIRVEPSRSSPIVLEDPTLSQPSHPNTGVVCPPFIFGSVPARPSSSFEHQITTSFTSSASSASSTSSPAVNLHKCFDKSPTVFQYAQDIQIHNVNSQKTGYVLAKIWKIRCPECTNKNLINDTTIEYAFCLFTVHSKNFMMIKILNRINELYCIDANQFRICCPEKFQNFSLLTREYFDSLGDLQMEIEEQKEIVYQSMRNGPLIVYLNGQSVTNHEIFKLPCVVQTVREITKLFFIELTLAIGEYMCKQVDTSVLYPFVMEYYENRNPMYTVVTKFGVEQNYEIMYTSLIPKLNPQL